MVWSTTAEWAVRRAALKRRQHFGGVLVGAGTTVAELDHNKMAIPPVATSEDAVVSAATTIVDEDLPANAAATARGSGKRKRNNGQASPSKNKQKRGRRGTNDLGDGVNTWRVAVQVRKQRALSALP